MSETMEILVGASFLNPKVMVVQEAVRIGYYTDPEGAILGPEYDASTESWMNRNDVDCSIFSIQKELFPVAQEQYNAFVRAAHDTSVSDADVAQLRAAFFQLVQLI